MLCPWTPLSFTWYSPIFTTFRIYLPAYYKLYLHVLLSPSMYTWKLFVLLLNLPILSLTDGISLTALLHIIYPILRGFYGAVFSFTTTCQDLLPLTSFLKSCPKLAPWTFSASLHLSLRLFYPLFHLFCLLLVFSSRPVCSFWTSIFLLSRLPQRKSLLALTQYFSLGTPVPSSFIEPPKHLTSRLDPLPIAFNCPLHFQVSSTSLGLPFSPSALDPLINPFYLVP